MDKRVEKLKNTGDSDHSKKLRHSGQFTRAASYRGKDKWEEIDRGEHADALVIALKKYPNYSMHDVEKVLSEQYPALRQPSPLELDNSLKQTAPNGLLFGAGEWVEYFGVDSRWHLTRVLRIFAKAPLDYRPQSGQEPKWEYSYNFGKGLNVPPYLVRAPEESMRRAFGPRPFLFMQWALLRFEAMVKFQENHQRDFEEMNFQYSAENLWEQFLNHPNNLDFKEHFLSFEPHVRNKLLQHLFSAFAGMDRLSKLNAVSFINQMFSFS